MRNIMKQAVMAVALFCLAATGAAAADKKAAPPAAEKVVIARVNGKEITKTHLEIAVDRLLPQLSYHGSVSDERMRKIQEKALDQIINNELIYKAAKDAGEAKVADKDIDKEIASLKKSLPKGESLDKVLKNSGMTMKDLREDIRKDFVVVRASRTKTDAFKKQAEANVTDQYMLNYYKKNLDKFVEPEKILLSSILIKADPSAGQKVWSDAKKTAADLAARARKGEDFAELAKKHSQDPNAERGGDMGWAHKGSLFAEIDNAAANLKKGEVSDPVMSIYGYHIIKLVDKKPQVQKKYEELNHDNLRRELREKEHKELWLGWLKGLREAAKVEILVTM